MKRLVVIVGACMLLAWWFAPALVGTSGFAFRDAAHFYRPQFEFTRHEWGAGRAPLWNPYENLGVPLVAENTSSVFYPGKLVFALPADFGVLYAWYIVLHVALAAVAGYALARHFGAGTWAAGLAAVSYAGGGTVLMQYANVVFLVGAAWLPLALLAGDRTLRTRRFAWAIALGAALALMVLGGDPQMAYNAGLLVALDGVLLWREEKRAAPAVELTKPGLFQRRGVLFGVALSAAGLLAAVQILPTLEAMRPSVRAYYDAPRNIYELAWSWIERSDAETQSAWYDGLLGRTAGPHERGVYQFSVAPWRAAELVWPNVTGRAFPTSRRWLDAIIPEGDLWTPTLYLGLLPLVLAAAAWSLRRTAPLQVRFLSWLVVIGLVASLGGYGIGRMLGGLVDGVGDEVGGLYWWMTVLLPKYVYFRFPAKWFVVANLGLSMLAARGWDEAFGGGARVRRWLAFVAALSVVGVVATAIGFGYIERLGAEAAADPILGPLDWGGTRRDVLAAFSHSAVLAALLCAVLSIGGTRPHLSQAAGLAALGITLVDLAIAQGYLVLYAPADTWRVEPKMLARLPRGRDDYRVFRRTGPRPAAWSETISPERYTECVRWERETLFPKYNLPYHVGLLEVSQTIASADYRAVLEVARRHNSRGGTTGPPHASILDLLAVRVELDGMRLRLRPRAQARVWIVHCVETLPEISTRSFRQLVEFTDEVLFPGGRPRDWRMTAVVETGEPVALDVPRNVALASERCTIVALAPQRVEIEATLAADGLVVLADLYDPGWELTVETDGRQRRVPVLHTNRVMRGAVLPPGTHRLVYRYQPKSVNHGGVISAVAWCALLAIFAVTVARRRG